MNLDPVILAELKRATDALQTAVGDVAGGLQATRTDVHAVGDTVAAIGTAVAAVAAAVATVNTNVNAVKAGTGIKSIQRGITTKPASAIYSTDVTISPVNLAKARLSLLTSAICNVSDSNFSTVQLQLVNATTLRVTGYYTSFNPSTGMTSYVGIPVSWEVIEEF
ncbi:MAG: hypothetical protein EOO32_00665 [Comamonadaceae bacterium]|nr:MAG: hypothetical protein EOO32_00665 [Comamonadaceae bacterium]